ncbi:MAG: hypothetical protein ACP5UA_08090 [Candidatus Hydrogenedens sp.]
MTEQEFIFNLQWDTSDIISILLLSFLFFWGVFLLYQKWIKNYDYPLWLDLLSLIIMFLVLAIELLQFKDWLQNYPLLYVLSALGLFITASALYSQSFISLLTLIFLSIIHPGEESSPDVPRFGPAEILERQNDWKGALNEYFVLARIYPHHPSVHLRIANAYIKMKQPEEALHWLKKSLQYLKKEEDTYLIIARYCDIAHDIGDIPSAKEMIDYFLNQYPESTHSQSILERKKRMKVDSPKEKSILLVSMEDVLLNSNDIQEDENEKKGKKLILEKINEDPITGNSAEPEQLNNNDENKEDKKSTISRLEPM